MERIQNLKRRFKILCRCSCLGRSCRCTLLSNSDQLTAVVVVVGLVECLITIAYNQTNISPGKKPYCASFHRLKLEHLPRSEISNLIVAIKLDIAERGKCSNSLVEFPQVLAPSTLKEISTINPKLSSGLRSQIELST